MPLLDHFHPPLKDEVGWHSFHHAWCTLIAIHLNRFLPDHYRATPHVQYGIEVDVAALEVQEQLRRLGEAPSTQKQPPLYTSAYRPFQQDEAITLAIWHESLTLGEPLPTMPLWLRQEFCAPLNLEATYVETCQSLRIPLDRAEPVTSKE